MKSKNTIEKEIKDLTAFVKKNKGVLTEEQYDAYTLSLSFLSKVVSAHTPSVSGGGSFGDNVSKTIKGMSNVISCSSGMSYPSGKIGTGNLSNIGGF